MRSFSLLYLLVICFAWIECTDITSISTGEKDLTEEEKTAKDLAYHADYHNNQSTLYSQSYQSLDRGQKLLEALYQANKQFKFEIGYEWTGKEILCNCTTTHCGDKSVVLRLKQMNLTGVCLGQVCYHQKRLAKKSGEYLTDEHFGCYGGEKNLHDTHDIHEPLLCTDTPIVRTRCCWSSFCQEDIPAFDYPTDAGYEKWKEGNEFIGRMWTYGLGIAGAVLLVACCGLTCYFCNSKRPKWLFIRFGKKIREPEGYPMMEIDGPTSSPPIPIMSLDPPRQPLVLNSRTPYAPLENESGGTTTNGTQNTATTSTGATTNQQQYYTQLMNDLDNSKTFTDLSGPLGYLLPKNNFLSDVVRMEKIGQGRYGTVFKARWREQIVAMKVLLSRYEVSYFREVAMYRAGILRHTNILTFKGNDTTENNNAIENCMVFEYHPLGSLDSFLMNKTVDITTAVRMIYSMASGLSFLHATLDSSSYRKPGIAHRDIKSGNVLVKQNLMVCIADLGLAVCYSEGHIGLPRPTEDNHFEMEVKRKNVRLEKCGTMRYLAPELLDDTFDSDLFDAFKAADMYAIGLVIYEICRRTLEKPHAEIPYLLSMPYFHQLREAGVALGEVDFETIKKIVVEDRARPDCTEWWKEHNVMEDLQRIMEECWAQDPQCRLTGANVVRAIEKLAQRENIDLTQT